MLGDIISIQNIWDFFLGQKLVHVKVMLKELRAIFKELQASNEL